MRRRPVSLPLPLPLSLRVQLSLPLIVVAAIVFCGVASVDAASVFTTRLDDPAAVYLTAEQFGAKADGTTDDSVAMQAAGCCSCRLVAIG